MWLQMQQQQRASFRMAPPDAQTPSPVSDQVQSSDDAVARARRRIHEDEVARHRELLRSA